MDVFRGRLSPRRALALVEQLPLDSRFATVQRGGVQHYGWNRQTYLLADLFDVLSSLLYVTVRANAKDPKKVGDPEPYPRPENKSTKPDILLARLRGEAEPKREVGPGSIIPAPPSS